jgi:hypothetical protein
MESLLNTALDYLIAGVQLGLLAGVVAGAITWAIMKTPESLFRAVFGFALGFVGYALFRYQDFAQIWNRISATAGGAIPTNLAEFTINLGIQAIMGGLVGATLVLAISSPMNTIRGALFGGLLGIAVGIIVTIVIQVSGLPPESLYYGPLTGLIVLVIFAVFGAGA